MANEVKNYFLAPSWDYVTEAGAGATITLWNLVTSPTKMVPPLLAAKSQPEDSDMLSSTKNGFQWTRERQGEKKFGVWTKFLQLLGLNLGHRRQKSVKYFYNFGTIETREAYPTHEYIESMVKDPSVVKYLKREDFKKPLYLVVGIKVVTRATVLQIEEKDTSTDGNVAVDVTPVVAPVALGPVLSISSNMTETVSFKVSPEFIFAFRLRKVKVNAQMEVEDDDDEIVGTALGEYEKPVSDRFDILGLEDKDMRISELSGNIEGDETEAVDDDETVYVTLPAEKE